MSSKDGIFSDVVKKFMTLMNKLLVKFGICTLLIFCFFPSYRYSLFI